MLSAARRAWSAISPRVPRFLILSLIGLVVITATSARALSIRVQEGTATANPYTAQLQPSEEARTLLNRADEAAGRQDWKVVIDALQRIIELPGEHVLAEGDPGGAQRYESARRHAIHRIARLPAAGLSVYRLVYDGEAAALLKRGREEHDPALLHQIVDRYLCTTVGDEAAFVLADWLIDEGRFSEAATLLREVESSYPGAESDTAIRQGIGQRLVVCAAALGQAGRAAHLLEPLTTRPAADPALVPDRRDALSRYVQTLRGSVNPLGPLDVDADRDAWTMSYGGPAREGRMPLVEPELDEVPGGGLWDIALPVVEPGDGYDAMRQFARRRNLNTTRYAVTDGRVMIVKGTTHLLALDLDSFTPLWQSQTVTVAATGATSEQQQMRQMFIQQSAQNVDVDTDQRMEQDGNVRRLLRDSVGAGVAIVDDLALTIEWADDPPMPVYLPNNRRARGFVPPNFEDVTHPNSIRAFALSDGNLRWTCPPRKPEDPAGAAGLGPMEFLAVPVMAEGKLLTIARANSDLYAVVINPADGLIERSIYLCGTGGGGFGSLHTLAPCVVDGVAYLPTGRGLLIAMETADFSIRWAIRYQGNDDDGAWWPNPPIAVADVVLLAPEDGDFLYCFDRATGELRWQQPRDKYLYLVAAGDTHVWAAGNEVAMLRVEDGKVVWSNPCPDPVGRGVLSGDRLYLPTTEGLICLQADSGDRIELSPATAENEPFGNLLAFDAALYSVGLLNIHKYVDLERGYGEALARHQADPADASGAMRLAWLELLKHQPASALAALKGVPDDLERTDERQFGSVIHLRVLAMLDLAASGELSSDAAIDLLRQARGMARSPEDAIASALALGDLHRSLEAPESGLEACTQYLALAFSDDGDATVDAGAGLRQRARGVAAQRAADVLKTLSEDMRGKVEEIIDRALTAALQADDSEALLRIVECHQLGNPATRAELAYAARLIDELRFEQAESHLLRVLNSGAPETLLAEASARLATVYLEGDDLHQPVKALALLDRLEHEYAAITLPAIPGIDAPATRPATAPAEPAGIPAPLVAAALRARLEPKVLAAHQAAMTPPVIGELAEASGEVYQSARPLVFRGPVIESLANRFLHFVDGRRVEARGIDRRSLIWPAELRLLGDQAVEQNQITPSLPDGVMLVGTGDAITRARGVIDGQTLIVNSSYGIHAVGLLTGRRLWSRPFDPPASGDAAAGSDAYLWQQDGYVISVDGRHIEVAWASQGDRRLWRASRPRRTWRAVRARGNYVVAVDDALETVDVFHLADGRYLGECRFVQNPAVAGRMNISLYDDVIVGPVSDSEVVALELGTPGVERWRATTDEPLSQIFKPSADTCAIADRGGRVWIIDPANGKTRLKFRDQETAGGFTDGAVVDGVLYAWGYELRTAQTSKFDEQRWALSAVDMTTGDILWRQGGLGARTHLTEEIMQAAANAIPIAEFKPPAVNNAVQSNERLDGEIKLTLLDRKTGAVMGRTVKAAVPGNASAREVLDVEVRPGRILVMVGAAVVEFPVAGDQGG